MTTLTPKASATILKRVLATVTTGWPFLRKIAIGLALIWAGVQIVKITMVAMPFLIVATTVIAALLGQTIESTIKTIRARWNGDFS